MTGVVIAARVVLVLVLLVAGAAKLLDRPGSRAALEGFGVPARFTGALGLAVPVTELVLAGLLVFGATAAVGAAGAIALMAVFCAGIAAALRRGEQPDCHCFGALHSAPAGPRTLLRNAGLAGVGVVALVPAGRAPDLLCWPAGLDAGWSAAAGLTVLLAVALGVQSWFSLQVLRQNGRLLERLEALEGAAPAAPGAVPAFALEDLRGVTRDLDHVLAAGRPALLLFTDASCGPCTALLPKVGEWQRRHQDALTLMVLSRGDRDRVAAHAAEHRLKNMLLDPDGVVGRRYDAIGTPSAVAIAADGRRLGKVASGAPSIEALVERLVTDPSVTGGRPRLEVVPPRPRALPEITLPRLDGEPVALAGLRDRVLILWNPGCGYCASMREDLVATAGADVLVVAAGGAERNRGQLGELPVLLDDGFAVGRALGARGTPSAVRVGPDGRVEGEPAVGAPAILTLLGAPAEAVSA